VNGPRWLDDEQQEAWRTYLFATVLLQESLDRPTLTPWHRTNAGDDQPDALGE
jgi:hypothetical protein